MSRDTEYTTALERQLFESGKSELKLRAERDAALEQVGRREVELALCMGRPVHRELASAYAVIDTALRASKSVTAGDRIESIESWEALNAALAAHLSRYPPKGVT